MSVIDEIKDRLDIVDVVSAYVPLKKAGRSFKGLCPFHSEKTPSFVVFPDGQSWHCFGACGTGGDIFSFVMRRENLDFGEALVVLAAKAGVELKPREEPGAGDDKRLERLRAMVADAAVYFNYLLLRSPDAEFAREYLARRRFTPETWETWQLGYSLDSWDALRDRLTGKGYRLEELAEAGLVIHNEEKNSYYDRFRGRLMIPIRDNQGRAIGFGARILKEDPAHPGPKYMNSPQTPLFDKSNVVFGLDMARKAIRDADLCVLVEGYFDVIMSHQVGVANVVAGMGTALTEAQMRQIKRYSSNLTLALDPDVAGEHAALRGLEAARQAMDHATVPAFSPTGMLRHESRLRAQLRIATLPDGLDPDELALQDVERWRRIVREAVPIVDHYLGLVAREENLGDAHGKARALERMAPLIGEVSNPIERAHYVQALARLVGLDERLVSEQIAVLVRQAERSERTAARPEPEPPAELPDDALPVPRRRRGAAQPQPAMSRWVFGSEEYLLGWMLVRSELLSGIDEQLISQEAAPLSPEDFADAENRALCALALALPAADMDMTPADRVLQLPAALRGRAEKAIAEVQRRPAVTDDVLLKDLTDNLLRLREKRLEQQIRRLEQLIRESDDPADREADRRLHETVAAYAAQTRHIHRLLNARTLSGILAQRKALPPGNPN
jgi:DNA primase